MSTNIHIYGEREIFVPSINKKDKQLIEFDAIQTPTDITYIIMASNDKKETYINYVKDLLIDANLPLYSYDDFNGEGEPIGYYNWGDDHIEKFNDWLDSCKVNGYNVIYEAW